MRCDSATLFLVTRPQKSLCYNLWRYGAIFGTFMQRKWHFNVAQIVPNAKKPGLLKILSNLSDVDCKNSSLYSAHTHSRPGKRLPCATNRHETHLPLLKTPKITPKFSLAGSIREGFTKKMSCFVQGNLDKIQKNSYFFFVKPSLTSKTGTLI